MPNKIQVLGNMSYISLSLGMGVRKERANTANPLLFDWSLLLELNLPTSGSANIPAAHREYGRQSKQEIHPA